MFQPLLIALQFLTRLPIRLAQAPSAADNGRSLLCYLLVGLGLGLMLVALVWLLPQFLAPLPAAALVLAVWIWLYGGLHLDALADSSDAWGGARGERERAMAIMKDPNSGPFGVVAVVMLLLIKFSALAALIAGSHAASDSTPSLLWPLALVPLLGRSLLLPLFLTTAYVRPNGLGSQMHAHLPRRAAWLLFCVIAAVCLALGQWPALLAAGLAFMLLRRLMQRELGGMTGDTAGALVEVVEAAVLLALLVGPH